MGKGGMDYKGQKLSEQIYLVLIPAVGSVAWVFGYLAQDFKTTFYGWLAGLVLAMFCLLYTSPSPRDGLLSRMPSSA